MDYSLADLKAVTDGNAADGFAGGGGWGIWLVLLFLFFGFNRGFGGFGGGGGQPASTEDVQNQFNFAALERQNNETVAAVRQAAYDVTGNAKDLAYSQLGQIRDVEAMVSQNGNQMAQCCCSIERAIDGVNYNGAINTNTITNAIHCEGEATRALIQQNTIQDLRDKVADLQLQQSQCAQNAYLTSTLRPYPVPAYYSCNPVATYGGCGCNGCGSC